MKELCIGVIGTGHIAQNYHLPSLQKLAEGGLPIRRCALCDLNKQRAQQAAERFGFARVYTDYRKMLEAEALDAVWVLVPIPQMREVAGFTLSHGIPTLMEKPPGKNSQEARELWELANKHGTPHQVAFNRRFAPLLRRMKELLQEAGEVSAVSCQFYRYRRTEPGFAYGTGLHGLDTLCFLNGSEVEEVHTYPRAHNGALVILEHANGSHSLMEMLPQTGIQSERYTGHAGERTVMVDGTIAWLSLYPGYLRYFDQGKETLNVRGEEGPPEVVSGFYGESAHFIDCLLRGVSPSPDL
ncbi:MAG: Gfo/Idh/MocA family oxidoreductase, partial [Anaerolineae bacterium]|nr:Gfo/Idh/MocA family oxidoreductase [Anaerolineae bacterium]